MRRILFVDDELHVLDGLRDVLRKQRKQWDMVFALGGQAALAELDRAAFDVVVSDMRMPGIDGAALLHEVRQRAPSAARIILSGQSDRESVIRAMPVAHQFLSKPCDAEVLRVVVDRACELQKLLQHEGIRAIIGKLDKLPSAPDTYWDLTAAANRSDVAMADLAAIVERDPAMSAKILQLVNSSYFGLAQRMTSVHQAVGYLGIDLLKALALSLHAFESTAMPVRSGLSLEELQQHSIVVARVARKIASGPRRAGEAFTAALVHDIGRIVLAVGLPDRFAEITRLAHTTGRPACEVERELLGVSHAEAGAYLLGFWGLPLAIVEAVAYHHSPQLVADGAVETLAAVHVADQLVHALARPAHELAIDPRFLERAGLSSRMSQLRAIASDELESIERGR